MTVGRNWLVVRGRIGIRPGIIAHTIIPAIWKAGMGRIMV
jgi:hypothetical protein